MLKNILLSGGSFATKMILQIGVFVYFANVLSIDKFGLLSYAFTLFWFVSNLSDYGYRTKIVKDISQNNINQTSALIISDTIKLVLSICLIFLYLLYAFIRNTDYNEVLFVFGYMISGLFLSLSNGRYAIFQAKSDFGKELKINILAIVLYCFSVFIIIIYNISFIYLALVFICYSLVQLMLSSAMLNVKILYFSVDTKLIRHNLISATPYALLVIANVVFASLDTIMLEFYTDLSSVAIYQVFVRINTGFMLFFNVMYTVLLPRFSQEVKDGSYDKIKAINKIVILIASSMIIVYQSFDEFIVNTLFGSNYNEIISFSFAVSVICLIKYSLWFSNELILVCSDNQKERVKAYCYGMLLTVFLFIVIIPFWGWEGAIYCSLIGTLIIGFIYTYFVKFKLAITLYDVKDVVTVIMTVLYIVVTTLFW
ncbi:oligosaccharide flippase family protein [Photobacterium swingsii]|uniref:oligosaccharide flippase family protein n=1 Tax=Photobacterium swingsii TaxID=680026 RepID=UPI004068A898